MIKVEWNALRSGDHVLVHDTRDAAMRLLEGTVLFVDVLNGTNDVAIRVLGGDAPIVLHPSRLAVHNAPLRPHEACWRCGAPSVAALS